MAGDKSVLAAVPCRERVCTCGGRAKTSFLCSYCSTKQLGRVGSSLGEQSTGAGREDACAHWYAHAHKKADG